MSNRYDTIQKCALAAIQIQDACNLSGVLHAWADMQSTIREHANTNKIPYTRHPINVLLMSKVSSLLVVNTDCIGGVGDPEQGDLFPKAYDWAKQEARSCES